MIVGDCNGEGIAFVSGIVPLSEVFEYIARDHKYYTILMDPTFAAGPKNLKAHWQGEAGDRLEVSFLRELKSHTSVAVITYQHGRDQWPMQ